MQLTWKQAQEESTNVPFLTAALRQHHVQPTRRRTADQKQIAKLYTKKHRCKVAEFFPALALLEGFVAYATSSCLYFMCQSDMRFVKDKLESTYDTLIEEQAEADRLRDAVAAKEAGP
eukprot:4199861-Amphidinium_carterae.1